MIDDYGSSDTGDGCGRTDCDNRCFGGSDLCERHYTEALNELLGVYDYDVDRDPADERPEAYGGRQAPSCGCQGDGACAACV